MKKAFWRIANDDLSEIYILFIGDLDVKTLIREDAQK